MSWTAQVQGLAETQAKLNQVVLDMRGEEFRDALRRATLLVTEDARRAAPVDTGRLRASILAEIRQSGTTTLGVVGTNVKYAAAVENGSKPHWPPKGPIRQWVQRVLKKRGKELESVTFLVQRAIAKRGTKPRKFLQGALEANRENIKTLLGNAVTRMVNK